MAALHGPDFEMRGGLSRVAAFSMGFGDIATNEREFAGQ